MPPSQAATQVELAWSLPEQQPPLHGCWPSQIVEHCLLTQA